VEYVKHAEVLNGRLATNSSNSSASPESGWKHPGKSNAAEGDEASYPWFQRMRDFHDFDQGFIDSYGD